ncbi:MAG: LPS export ABC transporter permease LptG [Paracoccaceae bacterium]
MRLYLYFAKRFTLGLTGLFGVFILLSALLEMIEVLRRFDSSEIGFVEILKLTALKMPGGLYDIVPLIVILSTLMVFLSLAKSSELVVARAAGRSALQFLLSPILVALLLGVVTVTVFNPLVAATSKQYQTMSNRHLTGQQSTLSITRKGLWLRQGSDAGQTVIYAERGNFDGAVLLGVTFLGFDTESIPVFRIEAESASLKSGHWLASNAKQWRFDTDGNAERTAVRLPEVSIDTDLTRKQILEGFGNPKSVPIWDLPAFINRLDKAGFSTRRYQVRLQTELALPLLLITMVLVGAGFTMRHTRFGNTGLMVLMALGMGFTIFFIRNFALILGENGQIPVMLAAWAPPAAGILLALGLLLHMEDG